MNIDAAYRDVLTELMSKGITIYDIIPINQNRYIIAKTSVGNFLIIYKREPFRNFYKLDPNATGKTQGESINVDHLKIAIQKEVSKIYVVRPTGDVFSIDMQEFLVNSIRWTNLEGIDIRSIDIHKLNKEFRI